MFKVIYATDTLDTNPEVTFFDTEEQAIDFMEEEIERRVSFQVDNSPYRIEVFEEDLFFLREIERLLFRIEDWRSWKWTFKKKLKGIFTLIWKRETKV